MPSNFSKDKGQTRRGLCPLTQALSDKWHANISNDRRRERAQTCDSQIEGHDKMNRNSEPQRTELSKMSAGR